MLCENALMEPRYLVTYVVNDCLRNPGWGEFRTIHFNGREDGKVSLDGCPSWLLCTGVRKYHYRFAADQIVALVDKNSEERITTEKV